MPTGYTAAIKDGISFEKFALSCARAFGALVMMRDDPQDAPIPEKFKPQDYNERALREVEKRLAELLAMPLREAEKRAKADYAKVAKQCAKAKREQDALRNKYNAMLAQVVQWQPPTKDHQGLKDFMVQQIRESLDFDCSDKRYWDEMLAKARVGGDKWLAQQIDKAKRDISYHSKAHAEEVERTNQRNEWVKQLRDSL